MDVIIPKSKPPSQTQLRFMLIVGYQKIGKTEALLQLPNSIHIDMQSSAAFYGGTYVDVRQEASVREISPYLYLRELAKVLEKDKKDFVIIDPIREFQNACRWQVRRMWRASPSFDAATDKKIADVVTDLPYGKGYEYLRNATIDLLGRFRRCSNICTIVVAHPKSTTKTVDGEDITFDDIDVIGSGFRNWIAQEVDAIGKMYRQTETFGSEEDVPKNLNILSFDPDLEFMSFLGTRAKHLQGKSIKISKLKNDGKLVTNWKKVFNNV